MSTPVSHEEYLSKLRATTWNDHLITSDGDIVAKGSWFGRICSCGTIRKGYSISKAQDSVMDRVIAYMNEGRAIGEEEESTRFVIAKAATDNLDRLVDHVLSIRPESKLQKIDLSLEKPINAVVPDVKKASAEKDGLEIEEIDSSVEADNASDESPALEEIDSSSEKPASTPAASTPAEVIASADKQEPAVEKSGGKRKRSDEETLKAAKAYIAQFEKTFKTK